METILPPRSIVVTALKIITFSVYHLMMKAQCLENDRPHFKSPPVCLGAKPHIYHPQFSKSLL